MIQLLCPRCRTSVDWQSQSCGGGHTFEVQMGVLKLLDPVFAASLQEIETSLSSYRKSENKRLEDPAAYDGLPFSLAGSDPDWAIRAKDAINVARLLPSRAGLQILDIGGWNGWLCHRLAALGHSVVAADYFADEFDGLGAQRHYSSDYDTIQMDLADLSIIDDLFDLVIVNHGLAFFGDPLLHLRSSLSKVRVGGILVVLGLQFFRNPDSRKRHVRELEKRYRERCGVDLFFRPTRAYLDWSDKVACEELGLKLHPYRHLWKRNLLSRVQVERPFSCYATMTQPA